MGSPGGSGRTWTLAPTNRMARPGRRGPGAIVRVSPTGNDWNDGSSWALAKRTVLAGLVAASALGGEVWVQAGAYTERITLYPFVHPVWRFRRHGERAEVSETGPQTSTILRWSAARVRGHRVGRPLGSAPSTASPSAMAAGRGQAQHGCGGGIYCSSSSPTILHNTITANGSPSSGSTTPSGGGIYCSAVHR